MGVLAERPMVGVRSAPQLLATGFAFCLHCTEIPMMGFPKKEKTYSDESELPLKYDSQGAGTKDQTDVRFQNKRLDSPYSDKEL